MVAVCGYRLGFVMLFSILELFQVKSDQKRHSVEIKTKYKPDDCYTKAEDGDSVFIHYKAYLGSGEMFDSSYNKAPLMVEVGGRKVIKGLNIGLRGMCAGEKRRIIIPPEFAYGKEGYPPHVPADATLTFDLELVSIKSVDVEEVIFRMLRFLVAPVAAICIVMYLYNRYQKFPTKRELKGLKKNKKRN